MHETTCRVIRNARIPSSREGEGKGGHTPIQEGGMGREEEITFHGTLREDLAVCCSNIRSLCLMRFLLYRFWPTDDLFLDASERSASISQTEGMG